MFDRFRSLPIWQPAVLVGALLGDAVRYSLASFIIVALGVVLGFRPQAGAVGVVLAFALVLVFGWLQAFVRVNPISHLVTATRGLMHGDATSGQIGVVLALSAGLVAVFGPLTMRRFRRLP